MTFYDAALETARQALSEVDPARVAAACPPPSTEAGELNTLLGLGDVCSGARALRLLARVAPETAAPLAEAIVRGLGDVVRTTHLAYLRDADAATVERAILSYGHGMDRPWIPLADRVRGPEYRNDRIQLKTHAPTKDAALAVFAGRRGRVVDYALTQLVSAVAKERQGRVTAEGIFTAMASLREVESGLANDEERYVRDQANLALGLSAHTLPLDAQLDLVLAGHIMHIDVSTFAARPELASPECCLDVLDTLMTLEGWQSKTEQLLIERLGERRYEPAAELIALKALRTPARWDHMWTALVAIGGPTARDALLRSMKRAVEARQFPWNAEHSADNLRSAARTLLDLAPDDAFVLFAPFFTAEALSTGAGAMLAREILSSLHGRFLGRGHAVTHLLDPRTAENPVLSHDARWVERLITLAKHPRLGAIAESLVAGADPALAKRAIAAAVIVAEAQVPPPPPLPKRVDHLKRYLAGEHDEVWNELRALGVTAADPAVADEVRAVAEETMRRVRKNVETLLKTLRKANVPFKPASKSLIAPKPKIAEVLAKYEADWHLTIPAALRALYTIVGAVDFNIARELSVDNPGPALIDGDPLSLVPFFAVKAPKGHWKRPFPAVLRAREAVRLGNDPDSRYATERTLFVAVDRPVADPPLFGLTDETLIAYLRRSLLSAGFLNGTIPAPAAWTKGLIPFLPRARRAPSLGWLATSARDAFEGPTPRRFSMTLSRRVCHESTPIGFETRVSRQMNMKAGRQEGLDSGNCQLPSFRASRLHVNSCGTICARFAAFVLAALVCVGCSNKSTSNDPGACPQPTAWTCLEHRAAWCSTGGIQGSADGVAAADAGPVVACPDSTASIIHPPYAAFPDAGTLDDAGVPIACPPGFSVGAQPSICCAPPMPVYCD